MTLGGINPFTWILWWGVDTPPDASPWRVARGCCLVRGVKDRKLPQTRAEW